MHCLKLNCMPCTCPASSHRDASNILCCCAIQCNPKKSIFNPIHAFHVYSSDATQPGENPCTTLSSSGDDFNEHCIDPGVNRNSYLIYLYYSNVSTFTCRSLLILSSKWRDDAFADPSPIDPSRSVIASF